MVFAAKSSDLNETTKRIGVITSGMKYIGKICHSGIGNLSAGGIAMIQTKESRKVIKFKKPTMIKTYLF